MVCLRLFKENVFLLQVLVFVLASVCYASAGLIGLEGLGGGLGGGSGPGTGGSGPGIGGFGPGIGGSGPGYASGPGRISKSTP